MTNKELQEKLKEFPDDIEVMSDGFDDIKSVRETTWVHSNYPYNLPDKQVLIIM